MRYRPFHSNQLNITSSQLIKAALCVVFIVTAINNVLISQEVDPPSENVYPKGMRFPIGMYSVSEATMADVSNEGFPLVQNYSIYGEGMEEWLAAARQHGLRGLAGLGTYEESQVWDEDRARSVIDAIEDNERLAWWSLPEEQTWTVEWKFNQIKTLSAWARKFDDDKRPTYTYLAGNYIASDIQQYVPYVDIIGVGAYVDYNEQPRQRIRWVVKQQIEGIEAAGYEVGPNYLARERLPVSVLQMFIEGGTHVQNGPESYHDIWSAICAGAKGVMIFARPYRTQFEPDVYEAFAKTARQLDGEHALGKAILFGESLPGISATITEGPETTPPFDSWGGEDITFSTINMMAIEYEGNSFILAVNDVDEPVSVTFANLPPGFTSVNVIDEGRTIPITGNSFTDDFGPWGVHLYQIVPEPGAAGAMLLLLPTLSGRMFRATGLN